MVPDVRGRSPLWSRRYLTRPGDMVQDGPPFDSLAELCARCQRHSFWSTQRPAVAAPCEPSRTWPTTCDSRVMRPGSPNCKASEVFNVVKHWPLRRVSCGYVCSI